MEQTTEQTTRRTRMRVRALTRQEAESIVHALEIVIGFRRKVREIAYTLCYDNDIPTWGERLSSAAYNPLGLGITDAEADGLEAQLTRVYILLLNLITYTEVEKSADQFMSVMGVLANSTTPLYEACAPEIERVVNICHMGSRIARDLPSKESVQ